MTHYNKAEHIKVLIIDDSAFSRQTIKAMLEKVPRLEVVDCAVDGYDGMNKIIQHKPDVITLDLEMPRMDGFSLLRWVIEENPLPVIVVSSFGDTGTVFKALELGAVDFIVKPTRRASKQLRDIEDDLLNKIVGIKALNIEKHKKTILRLKDIKAKDNLSLAQYKKEFETIAIGASTGGPTAIQSILTQLPENFPSKVIISQHMPKGFTRQFAERMNRISAIRVKEAEQGDPVEEGTVLICPGGYHMTMKRQGRTVIVDIKKASADDKYVPSVDMMMKSAAEVYGSKIMGIVLTGMGKDGHKGMLEIKRRGGYTVAESEESSVVFGMPQAVIVSGAADKVIPLEEISEEILNKVRKSNESAAL
jgi:two-component system chemotaxis response regulator CheB